MTTPSTDVIPASFLPAKAVSKISDTHRRAAEKCIKRRIPFVLYAERPNEEYTFYADYPYGGDSDDEEEFGSMAKLSMEPMKATKGERKFYIGFFDRQETPIIIKDKLSAEEVLVTELKAPSVLRNPIIRTKYSTERMVYQSQVFAIKTRLKSDKVSGKVVLSKVVTADSAKPIFDVAEEYFQSTPSVFRAVYFHPLTGLWMVATPEVLFKYHKLTHNLATMALAGTRPTSTTDEPWSAKNLKEHKYVVRYILKELKECLINPTYPKEPLTLCLGGMEHLCTPFTGQRVFTQYQFETTVLDLGPTPAVAGFPREYAMDRISALELHNRYCYGGWLGPDKGEEANIYVNLRSALLFPEYDSSGKLTNCFYNIYAGGGILSQSDPEEEWEETELKCMTLRKILGVQDSSSESSSNDSPKSFHPNLPSEPAKKPRVTKKKENRSK